MAIWRRVLFLASTLCLGNVQMVLGESADPLPKPAIEYVIGAFDRYPLVALSEMHDSVETKDFLGMLIRHPAFTSEVTDIVVEFGYARYQRLVDRCIAGEDVARVDLKQVWENTTQISGVWSSPVYENILSDIRAFNKTKSVPNQIRVLLGDPPIDWKAVTSPADEDMNDWRDAHYAWVVERERGYSANFTLQSTGEACPMKLTFNRPLGRRSCTTPLALVLMLATVIPFGTWMNRA
jgi:hypothetical protein